MQQKFKKLYYINNSISSGNKPVAIQPVFKLTALKTLPKLYMYKAVWKEI